MAAPKKTFQAGDYVKLNVGGHLFQTSVSTLTKYDSMLKNMLAHELTVDNDGFILIDRNGTYFEYILDFMRDALVFPTHDVHKILCILREAEYFQLQLLVDRCTEILEKEKLDPLPDDRLPFLIDARERQKFIETGKPFLELSIEPAFEPRERVEERLPEYSKHIYKGIKLLHDVQRKFKGISCIIETCTRSETSKNTRYYDGSIYMRVYAGGKKIKEMFFYGNNYETVEKGVYEALATVFSKLYENLHVQVSNLNLKI